MNWAWIAFLIWTAIGAAVLPFDIGSSQLERHLGNAAVRSMAGAILDKADAVWIVLAAINVYFASVNSEGLSRARRQAIIILIGASIVEVIGALTGFPFGPYQYTDRFGWRLGGVLPFTIPLAWLIVVLSGQRLVLAVIPYASRLMVAAGVGFAALVTDLNLEPVAWKIRAYWIWYPNAASPPSGWPPLQNFVSWFVIAFLLSLALPESDDASHRSSRIANRPVIVLALMNALFLLANIVRVLRS